jgi:RNA polymerase sigma-70 factor, ECF subfamily
MNAAICQNRDRTPATAALVTVDPSDLSDEQLIASWQALGGGASADTLFEELYRRHHHRVLRWCLRFSHDPNNVPDMVQEVFLKAFRNLHLFRSESKFTTWVYVIARNHCVTPASRPPGPVFVDEARAQTIADPKAFRQLEHLERDEEQELFWTCVGGLLNRTEAQVMRMHYGQEIPLAGISNRLGLTNRSGAKAYIMSARRKLEAALRPKPSPAFRLRARLYGRPG